MATVSNLASVAAATAAGYTVTSYRDPNGAQHVTLERLTVGAGSSGSPFRAYGESASLTTAKAQALSALNAMRKHRYAGSPGASDGATVIAVLNGTTLTTDVS